MPRPPTWEQGVTEYLARLEEQIKNLNGRIDNLYTLEITNLKVSMGKLETRVSIYAAIAGFIGMAIGGSLVKFIVH